MRRRRKAAANWSAPSVGRETISIRRCGRAASALLQCRGHPLILTRRHGCQGGVLEWPGFVSAAIGLGLELRISALLSHLHTDNVFDPLIAISGLGYFKDDRFEKRKGLGRIDARNRYSAIKEKWLAAYRNLDEVPGLSVRREVTAKDEWCAEAYMETDYAKLSGGDFVAKLREFAAFKVAHSSPKDHLSFSTAPVSSDSLTLSTGEWKWFSLGDKQLFRVKAGNYHYQSEYLEGDTPYLGATALDNGVSKYIDLDAEFDANTITIGKIECPTF